MNPLGSALYNQFSLVPGEEDRLDLGLPPRQTPEFPDINFSNPEASSPASGAGISSALSATGSALPQGGASGGGASGVASSTLGMAGAGVSIGSLGGPVGSAVGAGVGAAVGLLGGLFAADASGKEARRKAELDAANIRAQGNMAALQSGSAARGNALTGLNSSLRDALIGGR